MPTVNQLARRVMLEQSVLQAGEQASADEIADLVAVMRANHAEMTELGEIQWDLDNIPLPMEQAWVEYMAGKTANLFGALTPEIYGQAQEARRRLIALSAQPVDPRDTPVTDY